MKFDFHVALEIPDRWVVGMESAAEKAIEKEVLRVCQSIITEQDRHWAARVELFEFPKCGMCDGTGRKLEPAGEKCTMCRGIGRTRTTLVTYIDLVRPEPIAGELARVEHVPQPGDPIPAPSERFVSRFHREGELERPHQIHVDARGAGEVQVNPYQRNNRMATCPNCWERYAISDDPVETHHAAMRHKEVCKPALGRDGQIGAKYTDDQFREMVDTHEAQPHIVAMREWTLRGLPMFASAAQIEAHDAECERRGLPIPSHVNTIAQFDMQHPQLAAPEPAQLPAAEEHDIGAAEDEAYERDLQKERRRAFSWWKPWTWF